jgi:hypothetical protein
LDFLNLIEPLVEQIRQREHTLPANVHIREYGTYTRSATLSVELVPRGEGGGRGSGFEEVGLLGLLLGVEDERMRRLLHVRRVRCGRERGKGEHVAE